jgi:site-specific DNA-adenine methylase
MVPPVTEPNTLNYGDNLDVLRRHISDQSFVYLDPPFPASRGAA